MGIKRIGRHLLQHRWRERRDFPPSVLAAIEAAIKAGEATHSGQVRFVVEGALDGAPLFRNQPARERALDIFSQLRISAPPAGKKYASRWKRSFGRVSSSAV
jgi:hypothetical protein